MLFILRRQLIRSTKFIARDSIIGDIFTLSKNPKQMYTFHEVGDYVYVFLNKDIREYKQMYNNIIIKYNFTMGKFNNSHKDHRSSESRQLFFNTIKDMRKLIQKNTKSYTADTLGLGHKTKVPYNHLIGRRKVIKQKYKTEKTRAHEQSIQYDSNMLLLNSGLMKKKRQKDEYERNKYKYSGHEGGRVGWQSNQGFLQITKKDLQRINGQLDKKKQKPNNKFGFKGKPKNRNKNKNNKRKGKGKGKK